MTVTVGLDIGGTKIAGAAVDPEGRILATARRETPAQDPAAIVTAAADLVRELSTSVQVSAIGVACAGFVDRAGTTVLFAPNLAWREEPLKALLEEQVALPVTIENDANAAAWGEFCYGPARDVDNMLFLTIGTGIGGGIVTNGRLLRGAYGVAAEVGHIRLVPDGIRCGCGNKGCWEQYGSGSALVREARDLVASGSPLAQALIDVCSGKPKKLTGPDVTAVAAGGDSVAIELLSDLGRWIGEGAASVTAVIDPEMIVLGGGVAAAGDLLLEPAVNAFRRNLTGRGYRPEAPWALAGLGNDAGMIGAAALARDQLASVER